MSAALMWASRILLCTLAVGVVSLVVICWQQDPLEGAIATIAASLFGLVGIYAASGHEF